MSDHLAQLLTSRVRAGLLAWLVDYSEPLSVSRLAKALGFTHRAVRLEVARLQALSLIRVERVGAADMVRPNPTSPLFGAVVSLVRAASRCADPATSRFDAELRCELVACGAPLLDEPADAPRPIEEVLVDALELAHRDPSVLRVLPVVLRRHLDGLDWSALKALARRRRRAQELGMLVTLTARLMQRADLALLVHDLKDHRRKRPRFFFPPQSTFERELAEARTPQAVRQWGFLMNLDEDSFRSVWEKHAPA